MTNLDDDIRAQLEFADVVEVEMDTDDAIFKYGKKADLRERKDYLKMRGYNVEVVSRFMHTDFQAQGARYFLRVSRMR